MGRIGIELEEAIATLYEYGDITPVIREIEVLKAQGRILAEDIYAEMDNPPFNRSPLDGYAFRSEDVRTAAPETPVALSVTDVVYAGGWCDKNVGTGEAVRIMTGAAIPDGADCVIRQEDIKELSEGIVFIGRTMKAFENYCFAGEDIKKGTLILKKGTKLTFVEQGILSSLGYEFVKVYGKLKIALFVTGDELSLPGQPLEPGKIYDSNLQLLYGRLEALGNRPIVAKSVGDDERKAAGEISQVIGQVDVVITTGGVSVGEKDIIHQVLPILGAEQLFWRVNLKPGTPIMFSVYQNVPMIHLSGNPFAALTTFELMVKPLLARMSRDKTLENRRTFAVLSNNFEKASMGRRFLRGKLADGTVTLPPTGDHASGMLASMRDCNCLVDVPPASDPLKKGCQVEVILL